MRLVHKLEDQLNNVLLERGSNEMGIRKEKRIHTVFTIQYVIISVSKN